MPVRYDRPVSHSAFLARRLGRFSFFVFLLVVLAHRFGPLTTPDFLALLAGAAVVAAVAVPLALIGLARLWHVGALGGVAASRALLLAAPVLILAGFGAHLYYGRPMLYDVTTDAVDVPRWIREPQNNQQWMQRPPATPSMRYEQATAYPALTGRRYEGALDRVYQAVTKIAHQNRIAITATRGHEALLPEFAPQKEEEGAANAATPPLIIPVPQPRPEPPSASAASAEPLEPEGTIRIQGETRTLVLGFRFDVLIRLREEAETTLVDMRVVSRFGPHDLGIGADIATGYLHALDAELLGIAGD